MAEGTSQRLERCAGAVADAVEQLAAEREVRDEQVVAAVYEGMSQTVAARLAGISTARVTQLLLAAERVDLPYVG